MPAASILIVDDDPANLVALEGVLAPLGQRVVTARSGNEALREVLAEDFAVTLMDVRMPALDGYQTAPLIKERQRRAHVPIIFITAAEKDLARELLGYERGAVDYLFTPVDPDILRSKVAVFVE